MKTILSLLLLVVLATASSAQVMTGTTDNQDKLINRLDKQSDQRWEHSVSFTIAPTADNIFPVLFDKQSHKQTPAENKGAFSIEIETHDTVFNGGAVCNMKAHLTNNTDSTIQLVFRRWQTLPNSSWFSSVCFGDACYISFVDSLPWGDNDHYDFLPFTECEFKLAIYAPSDARDSMDAYIRIEAINTKPDDTVGFFLSARAEPLSSVGATNTRPNFKIASVYPSPLVSGSSIKVKLYAPENAGYSYTIFDNLGREVAFGSTRHQLMIGENTVEISSLDGLLTGSYLLRIKFNGGGSDAIPFQVIR